MGVHTLCDTVLLRLFDVDVRCHESTIIALRCYLFLCAFAGCGLTAVQQCAFGSYGNQSRLVSGHSYAEGTAVS